MILQKKSAAGTLESSDTMIMIEPDKNDLQIYIESIVFEQFGDEIRNTVTDMCRKYGIENGIITVKDRGALECTIKARLETAIIRSGENND